MKQMKRLASCFAAVALAANGTILNLAPSAAAEAAATVAAASSAAVLAPCAEGDSSDDAVASGDCSASDGISKVSWSLDKNGVLTISGKGAINPEIGDMYCAWRVNDATMNQIKEVRIAEGVTEIPASVFQYLNNLSIVTIPSSVVKIGDSAFWGCGLLNEINFPETEIEFGSDTFQQTAWLSRQMGINPYVIVNGSLIAAANNLEHPVIPQGVRQIADGSFMKKSSALVIPEGVVSIGSEAFNGCNFTSVSFPASLTSIAENAFNHTNELERISMSPDNKNYCVVNNVLMNKAKDTLILFPAADPRDEYTVPDGVIRLADYAFAYSALDTLDMADSVTVIGSNTFHYSKIKNLTLPFRVRELPGDALLNAKCETLYVLCPDCRFGTYLTNFADMTFYCYHDSAIEQALLKKAYKCIPLNRRGDVNMDGEVTKEDVEAIHYIVSNESPYARLNADIDSDGDVDGDDKEYAESYVSTGKFIERDNDFPMWREYQKAYDVPVNLCGDVDQDGIITINDAQMITRFLVEDSTVNITPQGKKNIDVNGDGKPSSDDSLCLLSIINSGVYPAGYEAHKWTEVVTDGKVANLRGDVNQDGEIDETDSKLVQSYTAEEKVDISEQGLRNADADGDGNVTPADSTAILQYVSEGWPEEICPYTAFLRDLPYSEAPAVPNITFECGQITVFPGQKNVKYPVKIEATTQYSASKLYMIVDPGIPFTMDENGEIAYTVTADGETTNGTKGVSINTSNGNYDRILMNPDSSYAQSEYEFVFDIPETVEPGVYPVCMEGTLYDSRRISVETVIYNGSITVEPKTTYQGGYTFGFVGETGVPFELTQLQTNGAVHGALDITLPTGVVPQLTEDGYVTASKYDAEGNLSYITGGIYDEEANMITLPVISAFSKAIIWLDITDEAAPITSDISVEPDGFVDLKGTSIPVNTENGKITVRYEQLPRETTIELEKAVTGDENHEAVYTGYTADLGAEPLHDIAVSVTASKDCVLQYGFGITTDNSDRWAVYSHGTEFLSGSTQKGAMPNYIALNEGQETVIHLDTSSLVLRYASKTSSVPGRYELSLKDIEDGVITVNSITGSSDICRAPELPNYRFYNGHRYEIFNDATTWVKAVTACNGVGGHLATITSAEENQIISELIFNNGTNSTNFIGGKNTNADEGWTWISKNEKFDYTNWGFDQPDEDSTKVYLSITNGFWYSIDGETTGGYICEWDDEVVQYGFCGSGSESDEPTSAMYFKLNAKGDLSVYGNGGICAEPAFQSNADQIKTITLSPNTTAIPDGCFANCTNLKEINLAGDDSPAGKLTIGTGAFTNCTNLETVRFTGLNTVFDDGTIFDEDTAAFYCWPDSAAFAYAKEHDIECHLLGDANCDGYLDEDDAQLILKDYGLVGAGHESQLTPQGRLNSDTSGKGFPDGTDSSAVLIYLTNHPQPTTTTTTTSTSIITDPTTEPTTSTSIITDPTTEPTTPTTTTPTTEPTTKPTTPTTTTPTTEPTTEPTTPTTTTTVIGDRVESLGIELETQTVPSVLEYTVGDKLKLTDGSFLFSTHIKTWMNRNLDNEDIKVSLADLETYSLKLVADGCFDIEKYCQPTFNITFKLDTSKVDNTKAGTYPVYVVAQVDGADYENTEPLLLCKVTYKEITTTTEISTDTTTDTSTDTTTTTTTTNPPSTATSVSYNACGIQMAIASSKTGFMSDDTTTFTVANTADPDEQIFKPCFRIEKLDVYDENGKLISADTYDTLDLTPIMHFADETLSPASLWASLTTKVIKNTIEITIYADEFEKYLTENNYPAPDAARAFVFKNKPSVSFSQTVMIAPRGDVSLDGITNVLDAMKILDYAMISISQSSVPSDPINPDYPELAFSAADVNKDGNVDVEDAQLVLNYYVSCLAYKNEVSWDDIISRK